MNTTGLRLFKLVCLFIFGFTAFSPSYAYYSYYSSSPAYRLDDGYHHRHYRHRDQQAARASNYSMETYMSRLPASMNTGGEKLVLVDPNKHVWGAYDANGQLIRAGLASAGSDWCRDLGRRCHTRSGSFRVQSLGSASCYSSRFPIPYGGAPMPYCMYFNGNQALHGSPEGHVVEGNVSHGCVRLHVSDAEWLRFNFVNIGTRVIVRPY